MGPAISTFAQTDFVEWDSRNWSVALDFWTAQSSQSVPGCFALELGSRHGGLTHWLASQGATVVCSDIHGPSDRAIQRHQAAGLSDRITYATIDATDVGRENQFDLVLFKSVLGAVGIHHGAEGQARAIAEIHRALRPGGELFFAENLVGSPLHRFLRRRFVRWGRRWRYVSIAEMTRFLEPFAEVRFRTVGFAGAFGRNDRQRKVLGGLDRAGLDRLVPERWRYVIVGVARK